MKKKDKGLSLKILYLILHKRLQSEVGEDGVMLRKDFERILGIYYHVPKKLKLFVLVEMEKLKMIENLGSRINIKINPLILDPEEEKSIHEYYKKFVNK